VAAIGAATSANHAASSADHARDARIGQQHVGGAQVAAARGHAAEAPTASSVRTLASWELGDREGQGEAVFVAVAGAQVDGPWRRHRAGPASAEGNELEAWRVGDEPTIERGRRGIICIPNIDRTISIRQLLVTPGWTVFRLPSTPRVVVSPDTVAFRPFSARSPLLPRGGSLRRSGIATGERNRRGEGRPRPRPLLASPRRPLCVAASSDAVRHGDEAGDAEAALRHDGPRGGGVVSPLGVPSHRRPP